MCTLINKILSIFRKADKPHEVTPAPKEEVSNTTQIQCFVTKRMIMDMNALGWKKSQYEKFSPQQIADIIKFQKGPN